MESAAVDHVDKQFAKFVLRAQSVGGITRLDDEPEQHKEDNRDCTRKILVRQAHHVDYHGRSQQQR